MKEINISGGNPIRPRLGDNGRSPASGLYPATRAALPLPLWPASIWLCRVVPASQASRGLVIYSDHFSPLTPLKTIRIHNQLLPEEAFPVLLCHPAYINSVQGMQQLSGEWGEERSCSVGEWQRDSGRTVLCDGLWLTANGTV